ncbi:cysteine desulfurase family protein [Candidatus Tisiphia endosymbiont of Ditula angustiorana]|uniref:cysteine desulfurase family protein n=1 Tax=Candidatus Tisiphia endosymbiont of Ditula angustiorana TaxID=3066272 RepID=UPI00312C8DD5
MLYLDHNSTTNVHPKVKELMKNLLEEAYNPSSIHTKGRYARNLVETAREQVARSVGVDINSREYQVIFTSSGTESNNLLMNNYYDGEIFVSSIEHLSIFDHVKYRNNIKIIRVDSDGIVDAQHLGELLSVSHSNKKLVSVMLANNESGVVQNVQELVKIAQKYGAVFHSDCVQAVGKISVNIKELGVDFATISSHKLGGVQGSSALIAKAEHTLKAMMIGGGQERNIRSGTENVLAIASFGLVSSIATTEIEDRYKKMKKLQTYLEQNLCNYKNVKIVSKDVERLPNTTLIIVPNTDAQTKLIAFDLRGIAVSSGSACSSGKVGKSHVLSNMGFSTDDTRSSIRVSFDYQQTNQDIVTFIKAFEEIYASNLNVIARNYFSSDEAIHI